MERNDERNDRMLDSNDLDAPTRSTTPRDAELIGNERPRRHDVDDVRLADARADANPADEIGEAVGGISGVLTGAALGSLGGPIGTIIGGIAGAVAGWWAGKAISEAATHVTHADEEFYRAHYERSADRLADRSYEDVRPAYQIGHLAGRNPEYEGRSFEEVEADLQRGWSGDVSARHGDWQQVRPYARDAYERGRAGFGTGAVAGAAESTSDAASTSSRPVERATLTAAEQRDAGSMSSYGSSSTDAGGLSGAADRAVDRLDDLKDRVDGNPESRPGPDVTDRMGYGRAGAASSSAAAGSVRRGENVAERAWDATKRGAERVVDRLDDVKDRIDGNPASRPGPDATDRPGYAARGLDDRGIDDRGIDDRGIDDRGDNLNDRATPERMGDRAENVWDRTKQGARNLADRTEDRVDDLKDRVDGNPASRPGPDATDRDRRL